MKIQREFEWFPTIFITRRILILKLRTGGARECSSSGYLSVEVTIKHCDISSGIIGWEIICPLRRSGDVFSLYRAWKLGSFFPNMTAVYYFKADLTHVNVENSIRNLVTPGAIQRTDHIFCLSSVCTSSTFALP